MTVNKTGERLDFWKLYTRYFLYSFSNSNYTRGMQYTSAFSAKSDEYLLQISLQIPTERMKQCPILIYRITLKVKPTGVHLIRIFNTITKETSLELIQTVVYLATAEELWAIEHIHPPIPGGCENFHRMYLYSVQIIVNANLTSNVSTLFLIETSHKWNSRTS